MLTEATYNLIYNVYQHGDDSGVKAFCKQAKSVRAKEIAGRLANYVKLRALVDTDGADVICDKLAAEEDWLEKQLGFAA